MSLIEPAALTAAPATTHSKGPPRYTRVDSVTTQDAGVLIITGDSIRVYQRVDSKPGIVRGEDPALYQFKRGARELSVMGYQPAHGKWKEWEGFVRARTDSLEFRRAARQLQGLRRSAPAETLRVAVNHVSRIDLDQTDPVYTTITILGVAVVLTGIAWLGAMASTASMSW